MMKLRFLPLAALALCFAACSQNAVDSIADWAPAGDHIRTAWAAEVSPANAHPEYPRPQMVRQQWKSLNGLWDYAITSKDSVYQAADGKILVPFAVESSLSGVGRTLTSEDALWYETSFRVPKDWKKQRLMLHFDAVDWDTEVFVNGVSVGRHTGGYTAFSYDVTPYLVRGEQKLSVKVLDATNNDIQPRGKQVRKPGGIWYTAVSGIWQSVWIEPVPEASICDYYTTSDIDAHTLSVNVSTSGTRDGDIITASIIEGGIGYATDKPGSNILASSSSSSGQPIEIKLDDIKTWSPDSPYLYGLAISIERDGKVLDKVDAYTAFRKISVKEDNQGMKRMALNNELLFQYGPLDQGWFPDGLYTAPTDAAMKYDLEMTKAYGFNMIRKHIKVEPSRWFYYCDQLGILVWQDMPSFATHIKGSWDFSAYDKGIEYPASDEAKANYYKEWAEIMTQVRKFPCIVVWVPFNEAWGQFDTEKAVKFTYAQDNTRLVNMSSGGNWVSGGVGDILDSHHYPGPYIHVWDPEMVVVLGEYGGIGLPLEGHLWQPDKNWGYIQYKSGEEATAEYVKYAEELKSYVEKGVSAAVYTQTTDVEGEVNGLMTYDRAVNKLDVDKVSAINKEVIASMK